jgi:hypothetical protein
MIEGADAAAIAMRAMKLANKAKRLFAGKSADVTGAALCELVALHLAGHISPDNPEATEELRAMMLEAFVHTVKNLVPIVEASEILPRLKEMQQRKRPN